MSLTKGKSGLSGAISRNSGPAVAKNTEGRGGEGEGTPLAAGGEHFGVRQATA